MLAQTCGQQAHFLLEAWTLQYTPFAVPSQACLDDMRLACSMPSPQNRCHLTFDTAAITTSQPCSALPDGNLSTSNSNTRA